MRWLLAIALLALSACADGSSPRAPLAKAIMHGRLIEHVRVDGVDGATTYRIRYSSISVAGKPIEVTGLAVVPDAPAPRGSRVVLSAAHGTTGLADECAPSRTPLETEARAIGTAAVANGWIVAATDYEGLGTPGRHPYLVGVSEGRSVLDAALAARQLPNARASKKVLIAGYSQGGHAAVWANEIAPRWTPELDVLGTFSGAPVSEIDRILAVGRALPIQGFVVAIVAGYEAAYANARPERYLTPEGVALLPLVDEGCLADIQSVARPLAPDALVLPAGPTDPTWLALGRRNNAGSAVGAGPVLIVHSAQDEVVAAELSAALHDRMCASGQVVERRVISAGGHTEALFAAYVAGSEWLKGRAQGVPPVNDCQTAR